ncbi:MAG TPA: homoserine kinase [Burkholderiales bacterium]|nr:homoserine kinase [Burkholderiales bacterium]
MSVFTTVSREQLESWLKHYSIGTLVSFEGIAAGIENTNYFVTTSEGRHVLTLFEKLKAHELPFYLNLQDHLAGKGVPCPRPLRDRAGGLLGELNGKPAALVSFLPGKDVTAPTVDHCAQAGALLAAIHAAGKSYGSRMDNPRGPEWWTSVTPEILPFLDAADATLLNNEVAFQARHEHGELRHGELPSGAIHADLFRDNVLFDRGRISGVIDFYFACTGAFLYDVAIAVNDWCLADGGRIAAERASALLDAYARQRPFTASERGVWPRMLRAAALRFWVSRLYDFHLPRPGELTHAKDPGHFRQILAGHVENSDLPRLPG